MQNLKILNLDGIKMWWEQNWHVVYLPPDLLLYKPMATWNLFVLYDEKEKFVDGDVFCASLYQ